MTWNYRVLKLSDGYHIVEVYYDPKGKIDGWTLPNISGLTRSPFGETQAELRGDFELMRKAFSQPVLQINKRKNGKEKLIPIK